MEEEQSIENKIKFRGKIQLIVFENFSKKYGIYSDKVYDIIEYCGNNDILSAFGDNIENDNYFNVVFLNYDNKEDSFVFLESFIKYCQESGIVKNKTSYPFFIFFENQNFNKANLYSYYLQNIKEKEIKNSYDLSSQNIYFINDKKDDVELLLSTEIFNYYYEFGMKKNDKNPYKIRMLFIGQVGSGKSTFINYLLGKQRAYSSLTNTFKSKGAIYNHSKFPILI